MLFYLTRSATIRVEAGHVWRSTPNDFLFLLLVLFPVRDMRRLATSPSRILEPPSSRGAMIVDHGANLEGAAPPVAPAGRHAGLHDRVFGPVPLRRQPRGALARFPFERNRSNDRKSRKIKILERVPAAKVCQLSRNLL